MKIVLNKCFGGFGLSREACKRLDCSTYDYCDIKKRQDSRLLKTINELGYEKASGNFARLRVVNIPDEATDWKFSEYDGLETIIYVVDGKIHEA